MKLHRTPIASAVVIVLAGVGSCVTLPAQAQQAAPAQPPASSALGTVTVTGIRASIEQSLNVKRDSDVRVEVISAEDIGKMPDKNVADSLQRVPGVTISSAGANEGGFDENDRVSMRGTSPSLTQTLINGHNVASGDWFVLNQTQTVGRSVSYTLLPSELVRRVTVHKSAQASDIEGGVVGTVDIETFRPLDFKKRLTLEASLGEVYAQLPKKTSPQFSALFNWKNDPGTLGLLVQAFSETRQLRRDGQELLGYEQIKPGSAVATAHPDLANVWYPTMIGSALFEQKRQRDGGLIDLQFKPSSDLTFDLNGFSSVLKAANYNRNYLLWDTHFINQGAGQSPDPGYVVRNGTLVQANFSAVPGTQYGVYDQISRPDAKATSNFLSFDTAWRPSDVLKLTSKLGTSIGHGKTPTQDVAEWNTGVGSGGGYALHGIGAADWNLGTANNASPAGVPLGWIFGDQNVDVKDREKWAQADGELTLGNRPLSAVKFGVRYNEHTRSSSGVIGQGPACKNSAGQTVPFDWSQQYWCPVGTSSPADPANYPSGFANYPSNFAGFGGVFPRNVWYYSPAQLAAYNAKFANRATDGSREDWASEFGLRERNFAGYIQGDLEGRGWRGNVGVRLVQTRLNVTNNVAADATTPGAITASAFGPFLPVTVDHTYNDILPSANLVVDLQKDLLARFAVSRTMTRPDYSALAGSVSLSPPAAVGATGSGSGGNPDLKPIRSTNLDATIEWYFAPKALLTASAFYMDLSSYVGYGQVTKQFMTFSSQSPQGFLADYVLTVPVNTKGKVKGFELGYQQPLAGNFGVDVNYTYTNATEQGGHPLVGASRNTYNIGGYFENEHFSARLVYNYRSKFYSGLDRSTAFFQDSVDNVAASLGWRFNDNLTITFDAHNLTNAKLKYYALNEDQPRSIYQSGRQYYLNARVKF
jgi:iron complex outermembrane receptor protein